MKFSIRVLAKNWSHSAAQEQPSKPKRTALVHFDESDESIEEEDELDAELSRLLIFKLIICHL